MKLVVGKTFDELVDKNKKDVLLAFVGLYNQQTINFETEFGKLARVYSGGKNLDFAKIDMFKNDFPDRFKPSSHKPTVYYIPAGDKSNPIEFQEETSVENLKKFIESNLKKFNKNEEL